MSTPGLEQDRNHRREDQDDDREITVYEHSEARRSFGTSEFWIFLVLTAALLIATYATSSDSLSREEGWRYAAALGVGYLLSRGLAKAGSSEPRVRNRHF
jgi:hypothetical protein